MARTARDRTRRQHHAPDRRAAEAQQAAYEASREVLAAAGRRRDAAWRRTARTNRQRAGAALLAPLGLAVVLMILGIVSIDLLFVGIALGCIIGLGAYGLWVGSASSLARRLGGIAVTNERRPSVLGASEAARLIDIAEGLFAAFGLSGAEIRVLADPAVNAISLGRSTESGVVFVTSGLVETMNRIELEAVLAHELAHIKRGDTVSGAVAVVAFESFGRWIPFLTRVADKVAGDDREVLADLAAVGVTRYPPGLASALEKAAGSARRPESVGRSLTEVTSRLWLVPFDEPSGDTERLGRLDISERGALLGEL